MHLDSSPTIYRDLCFFDYVKNANTYRSIVCLNGQIPFRSFFDKTSLPVIAVDGAANFLYKNKIPIHLILGDLDSVNPSILKKTPFVQCWDQDLCDFEKSMNFIQENDLSPCVITGINGGGIDRIIHNLNIFMQKGSIFYDDPIMGYRLGCGVHHFENYPPNNKLSLMGTHDTIVSTKGLRWDLSHHKLEFPGFSSISNQILQKKFFIEVHKGTSLLMIDLKN